MIFLGFYPFADNNNEIFKQLNSNNNFLYMIYKDAIFDEVHIIEDAKFKNEDSKIPWTVDTIFLWKGDSLEAGNIGLEGIPINQLLVKRRKKDQLTFEDIKVFTFDDQRQNYSFKDYFIESHEDYIYGIQPLGGSVQNPISGSITTNEVSSEFDGVWITSKDVQYQFYFNLEVGDYESIAPRDLVEPIGSKFPILVSNGDINYRRGNLRCTLYSGDSFSDISAKEEKVFRQAVTKFLSDKKPKYFKDGSGESMVISIVDNISISPMNNMGQLIYDLALSFVEIDDTNTRSLVENDLLVMNDDNI